MLNLNPNFQQISLNPLLQRRRLRKVGFQVGGDFGYFLIKRYAIVLYFLATYVASGCEHVIKGVSTLMPKGRKELGRALEKSGIISLKVYTNLFKSSCKQMKKA